MGFGEIAFKTLRLLGRIFSLGLYAWLKKKYGNKSWPVKKEVINNGKSYRSFIFDIGKW